jgi:hypothetical protein
VLRTVRAGQPHSGFVAGVAQENTTLAVGGGSAYVGGFSIELFGFPG